MVKWPMSLGQRDRTHQYDKYVIPLTPEKKIVITQRAHMATQKDLNKILKNLDKAILHYTSSHYGDPKVINRLGDARKYILEMKENIKKDTFSALPYSDLNERKIHEEQFDKILYLTIDQKYLIIFVIGNGCVYLIGFLTGLLIFLGLGVIISAILGLFYYFRWNRGAKTLVSLKRKEGPKQLF
jgi:hypothetical protein